MVGAVWLCADERIISSYFGDLYGPMNKMFSCDLVLPFIFVVSILSLISYICSIECTS